MRVRSVAIKPIQVVGKQAKKEAGAVVIVTVVVSLDSGVMAMMSRWLVIVVPTLIAVFVVLLVTVSVAMML